MNEPYWFCREEALILHDIMLARFGGGTGIRDEGMLASALARPQHLWVYEKSSLPMLAASYAFGVVQNHPFIDGNKRTGFMLAAAFLERNGRRFQAREESVVVQTLVLASGSCDQEHYKAWLEAQSG